MKKEICIVSYAPFRTNALDFYGVTHWEENGYSVKLIDISLVNTRTTSGSINNCLKNIDHYSIKIIKTLEEVNNFIAFHKSSLFLLAPGGLELTYLFKILKKHNIIYIREGICLRPVVKLKHYLQNKKTKTSILKKILLTSKVIIRKIKLINYKLPYYVSNLQPPRYILRGGSLQHYNLPLPKKSYTEFINSHSYDYYKYLKNKPKTENKYAVFLDQHLPYHKDFDDPCRESTNLNPDIYYKKMSLFFDWFEKEFNMPIIISAHPAADYDNNPNIWGKRKWTKNATLNLVAKSKLVLTHGSAAVSYAIILNKPLVFITTSEITKSFHINDLYSYTKSLDKEIVSVENKNKIDIQKELKINQNLYTEYMDNYVKFSKTDDTIVWEKVINQIKKDYL